MPGPPIVATVEGWADEDSVDEGSVDEALAALVNVEAAAGAPPERVTPMT
jgi:hypothetical protein